MHAHVCFEEREKSATNKDRIKGERELYKKLKIPTLSKTLPRIGVTFHFVVSLIKLDLSLTTCFSPLRRLSLMRSCKEVGRLV